MSQFRLTRVSKEPILRPRPNIKWEKDAIFNAAAAYHDGKFHLFYRGVEHPNFSCIGHAWSTDGVHFERSDKPILSRETPDELQGVEDPRVTFLEGRFYMLFTAWNNQKIQVGMASSTDLLNWKREGLCLAYEIVGHNKDAALFPSKIGGRYAVVHRPEPDMVISYSDDLHSWTDHNWFMRPIPNSWEEKKIGASAQPIYTDRGWLLVYHGVDHNMVYRLGIALLDLENPAKVLKRQEQPILEPELGWELKGDVPNVVFSCGALLFGTDLWVYYGGADTVIGVARGDVKEFIYG